ncbi:MAG: NAD(P)H-dependent glycerol-3-phosphate dehydrogenase [Candidatus Thermoplasmatota archaeon]|nr:NAD(P)H-dependent glycerol-3-phosphate dehydrogenase [Candidatus Thermoplasmatota archaeon]
MLEQLAGRFMSRIAVLGLGNWGTALALSWANDSHRVIGWTIEDEVYASIMENGENTKYLPGMQLDIDVTMNLNEAIEASELIVMALPSGVILSVVDEMIPHLRPSHVILDLAKGLAPSEEGGSGLISEAIEAKFANAGISNSVVVLTGPTIAPEVARGVITTAMVAGHDISVATRIADRLSTDSIILVPSEDTGGCELWGAFKNTVALSCGVVDGLRESIGGDNLKAALITIGFAEGQKLLTMMGAKPETGFGPAGLGDLYVTSASPRSRNRTLGEKLGSGKTLEDALGEMHMVAEGVRAARMFSERAADLNCDVPFINSLCALLDGTITAEECVRSMAESLV